MKQQTFIAILKDADGKQTYFERWACKRVETVRKNMLKLWDIPSYRSGFNKTAKTVEIYATPDGYTEEKYPVLTFELPVYQH